MSAPEWLETLSQMPPAAAWTTLFGGAFLEYVFPPFPGDTVVVAGAALTGALGWPAAPSFLAVTLGALAGSAAATGAGRWVGPRLERLSPRQRAAVESLVGHLRRRGPVILVANRFVPGIRGLFFVAAGIVGLRWTTVLGWSAVSAVLWNGLLFGLGWSLGAQVERLDALVGQYAVAVGVVVCLGVVFLGRQAWVASRASDL